MKIKNKNKKKEKIMELKTVEFRTPYNYDRDAVSIETGLACQDPSLAVQSQKDEADINYIVKRFGLTGQLPSNIRIPTYGDFTGITDYQSALNAVIAAEDSFMKLPADLRQRFNNDAGEFVEFCSDPKNQEEINKMGLGSKKAAAAIEGAATASTSAAEKSEKKQAPEAVQA